MPRKIRPTGSQALVEAARDLRKEPTPAEQILWQALRGSHLEGIKFRRQHVAGPYVLDFFCVAASLAVEVDGSVHHSAEQQCHDDERTAYLMSIGISVLRFRNDQVEQELDAVLNCIAECVKQGKRPHPPSPSPGR